MIFGSATALLILFGIGVIWADHGSRLQTFLWMCWFITLVSWFAIIVGMWTAEVRR